MAALGAQTIASSYEQLLHVDADDGGNGTTHVSLKDGDNGTTFALTLATDAVMMTSTNRLEFGDDASYIHQSADGVLDLVSDTEIELTATTIDINGAVEISGNVDLAGHIDLVDNMELRFGTGNDYLFDYNGSRMNIVGTGDLVMDLSGDIYFDADGGDVVLQDGGSTFGTMSSTGSAFNGDITASTGDIVFGAAGKGICLGVTSNTDANTLDDYEEGTWTPVYRGTSGSAGSAATVNHKSTYIKIGKQVIANMYAEFNNLGSWGGNMEIAGLPFTGETLSNLQDSGAINTITLSQWTIGGQAFVMVPNGQVYFFLRDEQVAVTISDVTAGSALGCTITYRAS